VHYATAFADYPLAAALIVDSIQATPWQYVMNYGFPEESWINWDTTFPDSSEGSYIGAPFFGEEGIKVWLARSPAFHLDRIRTPIRFEYHGNLMPPGAWDSFSILKHMRRPVELAHLPREEHQPTTPWGHYTSMQSSVDWFNFWLRGRCDPDPVKSEQCRRWENLRMQQRAIFAKTKPEEGHAP